MQIKAQVGCFKLLLLQGLYLNIVLLLAVTATTVLGLPTGAPLQACPRIYPFGHVNPANTASGPVPYTVNTSYLTNGTYAPGEQHSSKHFSHGHWMFADKL